MRVIAEAVSGQSSLDACEDALIATLATRVRVKRIVEIREEPGQQQLEATV